MSLTEQKKVHTVGKVLGVKLFRHIHGYMKQHCGNIMP